MTTIRKEDFTRRFQDRSIDVTSASQRPELEALDLNASDLNGDGQIHGPTEALALFKGVDQLDSNGDGGSVELDDEQVGSVVVALRDALQAGPGRPIIATQYSSVDALRKDIDISYAPGRVTVGHTLAGVAETNTLSTDHVGQADLDRARTGTARERAAVAYQHPEVTTHARVLWASREMSLATRDANGNSIPGSAIGHLTDVMLDEHLNTSLPTRDREGVRNMMLHVGGQAILTTILGRASADFAGDAHERDHASLFSGRPASSSDEPRMIDNYADLVNNLYGQRLGEELSAQMAVGSWTRWTPELTTEYLNGVQDYFARAYGWSFQPFDTSDPRIQAFTDQINTVQWGTPNPPF